MEYIIILGFFIALLSTCFVTVAQGTVAVITIFGKYKRVLPPGLNFRIPVIETIFRRISIQNQAEEIQFQAITIDQANVYFKAMLLFAVCDQQDETIKNVAFKFVDYASLNRALVRTVEGSVRSFVATQKQAEILSLRGEIVQAVKGQLDHVLLEWGYHLIDLQMNDISFDEEIIRSMAKVVSSNNLKAAAENEGQALLITKTKQAEAEGNAIRIAAEAERQAAQLRGQGIALFREEVAHGMSKAAEEMKGAGLDASVILFTMWTDAIKHFAETGQGNMIVLDGSSDAMTKTLRQLMLLSKGDLGEPLKT